MTVLITGASSGIGLALARRLAAAGARLTLAARREAKLREIAAELGPDVLPVTADVADPQACRELVERHVARFGRLDTLVANAGYAFAEPFEKVSPEAIRHLFAVNVFGTHDLAAHATPVMRQQDPRDGRRGQIVVVSSAAARRGLPFFGPYAATKAAQLALAEAMRVELAPDAIDVTSVHPITTATEFFDVAEKGGSVRTRTMSRSRPQTADHVAARMVSAIERPVPEVWPARAYRYLLALNTLAPRVGDRIMAKMRDEMTSDGKVPGEG